MSKSNSDGWGNHPKVIKAGGSILKLASIFSNDKTGTGPRVTQTVIPSAQPVDLSKHTPER
jgi:hypothetical protein